MYKIFLYTIFCLQTLFYVLYISLFKTTLFDFKSPSKFCFNFAFWPEPVDRPVDRTLSGQNGFSGSFDAYPCARSSVDRTVDRSPSVDRAAGRLKWCCSLFLPSWPTGRPEARNGRFIWTPVDRDSRLNSNDYFSELFYFCLFLSKKGLNDIYWS